MIPLIFKARLDGTQLQTGMSTIVGRIQSQLAGLLSAGAIIQFSRSIIDYAANIRDASEQTGVHVEKLQELVFAIRQVGGEQQDIVNAFRKLAEVRNDALNGDERQIQNFHRLGITMAQLRESRLDELMFAVARGLNLIGDEGERLAAAAEFFERAAAKISAMSRDIERLREIARDGGLIIRESDIDALDRFSKKWDVLFTKFKAAGARVLTETIDMFAANDSPEKRAAINEYRRRFGEGTLAEFAARMAGTAAAFAKVEQDVYGEKNTPLANFVKIASALIGAHPLEAIEKTERAREEKRKLEEAERKKRLEELAGVGAFSRAEERQSKNSEHQKITADREAPIRLTALQAHGAYVSAVDRTMTLANNVARQTQIQQNILKTIKSWFLGFRIF